jgi:hypothetical protein
MSYVQANTGNPLGRRSLGRMGLRGEDHNGAITYRIDPQTGQYQFYRTDIKPRGVFLQNTFQHPAPATMSALGARVLPIGKSVTGSTLQRGRVSQQPMIQMRPGFTLSGLGCGSCGGRCNKPLNGFFPRRRRGMRGMGVDVCGPQPDGSIIPCGPDPSMATEQGDVSLPGVTPVVVAPPPGTTIETIISQGIQQISNAVTGQRTQVVQPSTSWFSQSSLVGGAAIPNSFLAIGGALFAALAMEGSKGRRR